jgi:hypothetical protein
MDNLREPVRFASAVRAVLDRGPVLFIEISPHPVLLGAIEDGIEAAGAPGIVVGSLVRDEPAGAALLDSLGRAYLHGCAPDWAAVYPAGRRVDLPTYPWQGRRFWAEPAPETPQQSTVDQLTTETEATSASPRACLDALHAAAEEVAGTGATIERVRLGGPVPGTAVLRSVLRPGPKGWRAEVYAGQPGTGRLAGWALAASARIRPGRPARATGRYPDLALLRTWCRKAVEDNPALWRREGEALGAAGPVPAGTGAWGYLLERGARVLAAAVRGDAVARPAGIRRVALPVEPTQAAWLHARLRRGDDEDTAVGDVVLMDAAGQPVGELAGLAVRVDAVGAVDGLDGLDGVDAAGADAAAAPPAPVAVPRPRVEDPPAAADADRLAAALADLLGVPPGELDRTIPLPLLGVDSLLAVRLRDRIARDLGVDVPVRALLARRSLADLAADLRNPRPYQGSA